MNIIQEELSRLARLGGILSGDGTIEMPDGTWGCRYCSGCGYEDYPSTKKPCRITGHADRHNRDVSFLFGNNASSISIK